MLLLMSSFSMGILLITVVAFIILLQQGSPAASHSAVSALPHSAFLWAVEHSVPEVEGDERS